MSLLTIVQCATDIIGLPRPSQVIGSTDQTVRTLLALLNREGQNLARLRNTWGGGWTILEQEHVFTTVADQDAYDFPSNFSELIFDTVWNRTDFSKRADRSVRSNGRSADPASLPSLP